ncbi:MAG: hypothetical protein V3U85_08275, partial [Hyphomicrobium sp.]
GCRPSLNRFPITTQRLAGWLETARPPLMWRSAYYIAPLAYWTETISAQSRSQWALDGWH